MIHLAKLAYVRQTLISRGEMQKVIRVHNLQRLIILWDNTYPQVKRIDRIDNFMNVLRFYLARNDMARVKRLENFFRLLFTNIPF